MKFNFLFNFSNFKIWQFLYSKDTDVTDISFGLSHSDVNYLQTYESNQLSETAISDLNAVDTDSLEIPVTTNGGSDDFAQSETQVVDYSGALRQQFSHLKLPSDTLPDVPDPNHFVQSCNGSTNLLGLMDVPNKMND